MKPVIGLIPLYDDDKESYWMLPGYMKAVEKCGGLPIMLPFTEDTEELTQAFDMCDGILLTGGHDVGTYMYNEEPTDMCGIPCKTRDNMEQFLLLKAIDKDKPVLGICRGIQFMNACLGGNLYQDLPTEYDSDTEHHMSPPYDAVAHEVNVVTGTRLADIIGAGRHGVNSYHHQAVKNVAEQLTIMAISEDGIVEAVGIEDKRFIIGVQWHPEFSYLTNADSMKIMQAFVDSCK